MGQKKRAAGPTFWKVSVVELENLLTECQYLSGLVITIHEANWIGLDFLFKIIAESSPASLYKFKFYFANYVYRLESFFLFFDCWKGRRPMLLETMKLRIPERVIDQFKAQGIIEEYEYNKGLVNLGYDDFEWI